MVKKRKIALAVTMLVALAASSAFGFKLGGKEVVKFGTGARSKAFLTVYYASLYAPQELKGKGWKAVVDADQPMSVILLIDTRFMSTEKLTSATSEGFNTSAKAGYPTAKKQQFLNQFKNVSTVKGDRFYFNYVPGKGVTTSYKSKKSGKTKVLGTVKGLEFKKALYAIWIGPKPVQSSLKKRMLGN